MASTQKIYLAGPDVFYEQVLEIAARKKQIIHDLSNGKMIGYHPFDKEIIDADSPIEKGRIISRENRKMMDECDIILANITPFRGANVDDGTAFEIGYMAAQGKPACAYSNAGRALYGENVEDWVAITKGASISSPDDNGYIRDHNGASIEQFGFPCNLMIGEMIEGRFAVTNTQKPATDLTAFEEVVGTICSCLH